VVHLGSWSWLAGEVVDDVEGLGAVVDDEAAAGVHVHDCVDFLHVGALEEVCDRAGVEFLEVEGAEFAGAVDAAVLGVEEADGLVGEAALAGVVVDGARIVEGVGGVEGFEIVLGKCTLKGGALR